MGIVEKLKKEYVIEDEWLGLEIHPETPIQGVDLNSRFGADNLKKMKENLINSGEKYGIKFGKLSFMPNSHNSLEAAEYARSIGRFEEYHKALMDAYFRDDKDIGQIDILVELGKEIQIDHEDLYNSIKEKRFEAKIKEYSDIAHQMGINSTPTFIINDKHMITGAQPIEVFRKAFDEIIE